MLTLISWWQIVIRHWLCSRALVYSGASTVQNVVVVVVIIVTSVVIVVVLVTSSTAAFVGGFIRRDKFNLISFTIICLVGVLFSAWVNQQRIQLINHTDENNLVACIVKQVNLCEFSRMDAQHFSRCRQIKNTSLLSSLFACISDDVVT